MTDLNNESTRLSWSNTLQSDPGVESQVADLIPTEPEEQPPGYAVAQRPTTTLTYSFSQLGFNSMLLVPPSTAPDTRPQYYICTNLNVFMPLAYVTTVYRGSNEYGELVGEFEMGIINTPAKLKMRSMQCPLGDVLRKIGSGLSDLGIWQWTPTGPDKRYRLRWTYHYPGRPGKCTRFGKDNQEILLAQFSYPGRNTGQLYNHSHLKVTVAGQTFFDHILVSVLAIERQRLTPRDYKVIFNQ